MQNFKTFDILHAFYMQQQLLLSVRPSQRNSVRLSVPSFVRHAGGSVKNGAS